VLCDLGRADDDLTEELDGVPLIARGSDGWLLRHGLWHSAPGIVEPDDERAAVRRRTVEHLTERGRFEERSACCRRSSSGEAAPPVLRVASTRFVGAGGAGRPTAARPGDPDRAQAVAHWALGVDQWSEEAYGVLVGSAFARGDRPGAHRMLDRRLAALDDLGVGPSEATQQLRRRALSIASDRASWPLHCHRPEPVRRFLPAQDGDMSSEEHPP